MLLEWKENTYRQFLSLSVLASLLEHRAKVKISDELYFLSYTWAIRYDKT